MQKDIAEKRLEDHEDVFADIVNVLVFQGKSVLTPDTLVSIPTESFHKGEDGKWRQRWRDVTKKDVRNGAVLTIFGIENQEERDNTMPIRVMGYDFASYDRQIQSIMKENKKQERSPYLQRIHDDQRLAPVITLVLSFDTEKWERPLSVRDMLKIPDGMPEVMDSYIQNYRMNLVEVSRLPDEVVEQFQSDFGLVAAYMKAKTDQEKMNRLMEDRERRIQHPAEFLDMMETIASDRRYREIKGQVLKRIEKEEATMCVIADEFENRGIAVGLEIGRKEGLWALVSMCTELGMTRAETLKHVKEKFSLSEEKANDYLMEYWKS